MRTEIKDAIDNLDGYVSMAYCGNRPVKIYCIHSKLLNSIQDVTTMELKLPNPRLLPEVCSEFLDEVTFVFTLDGKPLSSLFAVFDNDTTAVQFKLAYL